jgi:SAM-dependent methyltransferase
MEPMIDWKTLWKELVKAQAAYRRRKASGAKKGDHWKDKARRFDQKVKGRWERPDPHRKFILSRFRETPEATVLDIGAGTGAWAMLMAPHVAKVTALEPSDGMRSVMKENLRQAGIENVEILEKSWPCRGVEPHDYSFCSHAMYGVEDLPAFIRAMVDVTRQTCLMLIRAPDWNGLLATGAKRVWGQPNDSPNFQVAYNMLLQMGIHPNVLMEEPGLWPPWSHNSFSEALLEFLRRFNVNQGSKEAEDLQALLESRLIFKKEKVIWPAEVRTALVYWDILE